MTLSIVLVGSILILVGVRIFYGNEDTWICNGVGWVKHGNPSLPVPTTPCGTQASSGDQSQWVAYTNDTFGFEVNHPKDWAVETYGPFQPSSQKMYEILLAQPTSDYENNPNRAVYWTIDVWKQDTTNSQIASDPGYSKFDVKDFNVNSASVLNSSVSSSTIGGNSGQRLFVIQSNKYMYSLKSNVCNSISAADCEAVLSSFRLLK